jgi:hypothetical protein
MAGVLVTLDSWRALVDHVLCRRMPALVQALRLKERMMTTSGGMLKKDQDFEDAKALCSPELAKLRDYMPQMPPLLRMVHYGYSPVGAVPEDENMRIEERVTDFNAFVGDRPESFWAQEGAAAAPAPASA